MKIKNKFLIMAFIVVAFLFLGTTNVNADTLIGNVSIDGFNIMPIIGNEPVALTLDSDAKYIIVKETWVEEGTNNAVTTFENKKYVYTLILAPLNELSFDLDSEYVITSINWSVFNFETMKNGEYDGCLKITGVTKAVDPTPIGDITIDGSIIKPVVGDNTKELTIEYNSKYFISFQFWTHAKESGIATSFVDGKDYIYGLYIEPKTGYYFDPSNKITINGIVWTHPDSKYITDGPYAKGCLSFRGVVGAHSLVYDVIEGENLKTANINEFKFRVNADFSKFSEGGKVFLNGLELSSMHYTATNGSTIIAIKPYYVENLPIGEVQSIKVMFNDGGVAVTNFIRLADSIPEDENPGDGEELEGEPEDEDFKDGEELEHESEDEDSKDGEELEHEPEDEDSRDGEELEGEPEDEDSRDSEELERESEDENPGNDEELETENNSIVPTEEKVSTTPVVNNPQTGDSILMCSVLFILNLLGITVFMVANIIKNK